MPANIEIKARVADRERLEKALVQLAGGPGELLLQEDTFFHTTKGRLKLRVIQPDKAELIYYERPDTAGPKKSEYLVAPVTGPDSLRGLLAASLGIRGVVRKRRLLYLLADTRVHLDEVDGLGTFLELEVMMPEGADPREGAARAAELMKMLGLNDSDLVSVAYIDLLAGRADSE